MFKYNELFISDSLSFMKTLQDNLPANPDFNTYLNNFDLKYVNLAIIDNFSDFKLPVYKIKNLINLDNPPFRQDEISLKKPVKLTMLLGLINYYRRDNYIFHNLTLDWIYDEKSLSIVNNETRIILTAREHQIFKLLFLNRDKADYRQVLIQNLAGDYFLQGASNNLEVYLNKLRNKLPEEISLHLNIIIRKSYI